MRIVADNWEINTNKIKELENGKELGIIISSLLKGNSLLCDTLHGILLPKTRG